MANCAIFLNNYSGTLYPGNKLEGKVVCNFSTNESVREIRVKFEGNEHTGWRLRSSVDYTGNTQIVALQTTLAGAGNIDAGRYEYAFNFSLPTNLPGSFNNDHGWIKYRVKATVDRLSKDSYEDEKYINIVAPINFNETRGVSLQPVHCQDETTVDWLCCNFGTVTMDVSLDKEVFVVGETVKVKLDIQNLSDEEVERIYLKLEQAIKSVVYVPRYDCKYDVELLNSNSASGVGRQSRRTCEIDLTIPPSTVVPNFNLCTLFQQECTLTVVAIVRGCHSSLEVHTGIKLGHIPITVQGTAQILPLQQPGVKLTAAGEPSAYSLGSSNLMPVVLQAPAQGATGFVVPEGAQYPNLPANTIIILPTPNVSGLNLGSNIPLEEFTPSAPTEGKENNASILDDAAPPPTYSEAVGKKMK